MNATVELTPYQQLGGDTPLRQLVDRFYDVMLSEPSVETVRDMHRADTTQIRERLFDFLSGWLGGPSRFIEKHGHPRLRMRHRFFQIGDAERDQWMLCMRQALAEITMDATLRVRLEQAIMQMAEMLRNDAPRTCDGGGFGCSALTPGGERCGR